MEARRPDRQGQTFVRLANALCIMVVHENVGLHNVAELEPTAQGGVLLRRIPASVRQELSTLGRMVSQESAGCEVRFVTDSPNFRVHLDCLPTALAPYEQHENDVWVYRGAFFHSRHRLTVGRINAINFTHLTGGDRFGEITEQAAATAGFAPQVWRFFFGRYPAIWHGIDAYGGTVRPPQPHEVPARSWAAYGSSITSGAGACMHPNGYVYHAARALGFDVSNLGLSGSCHCEPAMAEYLASSTRWEMVTLEVGVNMRAAFGPEQYEERVRTLLQRLTAAGKKVTCITIFPNSGSAGISSAKEDPRQQNEIAFNQCLRQLATQFGGVALLEGSELLDEFGGLTTDLIHPGDYGHARMGYNLALRMKEAL